MKPHMNIFKNSSSQRKMIFISLLLVAATVAAYWQVHEFNFVGFDDDSYVYENLQVRQGLGKDSLIWAFTAVHAANWHPVTWLSYMLDYQLFGMDSGKYHLVNLFFHIVNALLLFFILRKMTGGPWRSAMVAALFALHPLHVESVAWVSERKDVLSAFFFMLTLWAYAVYVARRSVPAYLLMVFLFACGLMAKPMLVTLPFVLLLLDYWPLNRLSFAQASGHQVKGVGALVLEKLPLFILALLSSGITYYAQQKGGTVATLDGVPLSMRIANALVAYAGYIGKMFYPVHLACLYPYPKITPWWKAAIAGLSLAAITLAALRSARKRPYLIVGWLWYLGTLAPVIGIVQVGSQSMADRYTYLPLIGLFIMIAWGIPEFVSNSRLKRIGLPILSFLILCILWGLTWHQVRYWLDSRTLFEHALGVTSENAAMHYDLANAYRNQGRLDLAVDQYTQTLRIHPDHSQAHNNLGSVLLEMGRTNEAISHYRQAVRIDPDYADARYNLGIAYVNTGKIDRAVQQFRAALRLRPSDDNILNTLNKVLMMQNSSKPGGDK